MKPDLLDELRVADPARAHAAAPDPDWDAMARLIVAAPRDAPRPRRRRPKLVLALASATAVAAVAAVALLPGGAPPTVLERAYAAVSQNAVYHYTATTQELEGPQRRPLADTRSSKEGWIDPTTGEIHEIFENGDEMATDGRRRTMYTAFDNGLMEYAEPPVAATTQQAPDEVLIALTRSLRAGALQDDGLETFEGRRVRRLVAVNPQRTWRQTFLVDAGTYLPVLFRSETGDYVRDGGEIPSDQRVIEERFDVFERLPEDTDRSVLELRPHPDASESNLPRPATP
jgi:hypothetical protein